MSVSEDAAVEAGLKVGMEIDAGILEKIEHSKLLSRAKNKAYDYLSYGDMSEKKLYDKLIRYGFCEQIARECVENMTELGYINNLRYAGALADSLANNRLYGPRRIEQELRARGISADDAQCAMSGLCADYEKNIQTLARGSLKHDMSNPQEIKKLIGALMRRGYDYDIIKSSLSAMLEQEEIYE